MAMNRRAGRWAASLAGAGSPMAGAARPALKAPQQPQKTLDAKLHACTLSGVEAPP